MSGESPQTASFILWLCVSHWRAWSNKMKLSNDEGEQLTHSGY